MSTIKKIRERSEIPQEYTWALEDLYLTDDAWEKELLSLDADQAILTSFAGRLCSDGKTLYDYLSHMEKTDTKVYKLANYCMRRMDQDTRNAFYQSMAGKFNARAVALRAACSFEKPEIMAISDEQLALFYSECSELIRYRRYLTELRRRRAHSLSESEERLLAAAGEMGQTPSDVFSAFADADLRFPGAIDQNGEEHPLTNGTFVSLEKDSDRVLRKSAYDNLYHTIGEFRNTAAALLNAQNKQLKFFAEARKYSNAFEAALDQTGVPVDVYTNLIDTVHRNFDKMHRYIRLRKKLLGYDELHFYDIHVPLIADVDKEIPYEEAKQTVYDALAPLGHEYQSILKEGLDHRWVDVYENVGKRGGAYSAGSVVHPFVLMNYSGTLNSQFTLAHEMGHSIHSYYSHHKQNFIDSNYSIFVAEVASTCNEVLLMRYLLNRTADKKERAYLINHFLEQFKGVIYRQTLFAEFELIIGKMVEEGKILTADILCAEYRKLNELYYGPDIVVDGEIGVEWARIPHFYYNYYVFQYSTGYSAAIALSSKILSGDQDAVKKYIGFLSAGCTKPPIELLKDAGIDMTKPQPVNDALMLFDELLDEMEALMQVNENG